MYKILLVLFNDILFFLQIFSSQTSYLFFLIKLFPFKDRILYMRDLLLSTNFNSSLAQYIFMGIYIYTEEQG